MTAYKHDCSSAGHSTSGVQPPGAAPYSPATPSDWEGPLAFGFPGESLRTAWSVKDICAFLRISERKARDLMKSPGAPTRLNTASLRCDRWNAYEVMAWLHNQCSVSEAEPLDGARSAAGAPARAARRETRDALAPGRPWVPSPRKGTP